MKWITVEELERWAGSIDASTALSELVSTLIRASAPSPKSFRFPTGDSAQLAGYDGTLESEASPPYVPEGKSGWEFGSGARVAEKAEGDYRKRTDKPLGASPAETTFVFVTPRTWGGAEDWIREKNNENHWKKVRVIDGLALEYWLFRNPAVAVRLATDILRLMPNYGVRSTDQFWDEYSSQFDPSLGEPVLLAGRSEQSALLLQHLQGIAHAHLWQADSLEEVIAFAVAAIRSAEDEARKYLEAKTLIVDTKDAAQQLANRRDLILLLRGTAADISGLLGKRMAVIVPIGQDRPNRRDANILKRPQFHE